jgi:hypothetical protein
MLSAAKHLQFRPKTNPMQILRFAQNDGSGAIASLRKTAACLD